MAPVRVIKCLRFIGVCGKVNSIQLSKKIREAQGGFYKRPEVKGLSSSNPRGGCQERFKAGDAIKAFEGPLSTITAKEEVMDLYSDIIKQIFNDTEQGEKD